MKKVIVGSTNPVKVQAALLGFQRMFPDEEFIVEGVSVASGVSDQPRGQTETYNGAHARMLNACAVNGEADFWVGMEGGVEDFADKMMAFAWILIRAREGRISQGKTGTFVLPSKLADLVRQGHELGVATTMVLTGQDVSRHRGGIGFLTGGAVDRAGHYANAVVLALIPFKHLELYRQP